MSHTATYTTETGDLVIEFDYEPAELKTFNDPGCPENVDAISVLAGPIGMIDWISEEALDIFKEKCLESVADTRFSNDLDRGQDRYEDRMAA